MRYYIFVPLIIGMWVFAADAADKPRYGTWQSEQNQLQTMTEELRRLVDEASRARAADPQFLDDLRALANRYGNPWPIALLNEDFRDGDFTLNPVWTVATGRFEMDWQGGLHSNVVAPTAPVATQPAQEPPARRERGEDIALRLLGQILNPKQSGSQETSAPAPTPVAQPAIPAEAFLNEPISNAFSLTATLAMDSTAGPLTLAVFQGQRRTIGYFLVYDAIEGLQLQRRGSSNTRVIATGAAPLNDGANHIVKWTRARDGEMIVFVDDAEIMRVADGSFRDSWAGVTLVNGGGAATLRALTVYGTR
jgi:hypothetical protein